MLSQGLPGTRPPGARPPGADPSLKLGPGGSGDRDRKVTGAHPVFASPQEPEPAISPRILLDSITSIPVDSTPGPGRERELLHRWGN